MVLLEITNQAVLYEMHNTVDVMFINVPRCYPITNMTFGTAHLNKWLQLQHNHPAYYYPQFTQM